GFPKVLGVIDGTHINIPRPKEDANSYINRKGRFSIQLQFIHVFAGMPGCVHDMRVFRYSGIQQYCTPKYFPDDSHLLSEMSSVSEIILSRSIFSTVSLLTIFLVTFEQLGLLILFAIIFVGGIGLCVPLELSNNFAFCNNVVANIKSVKKRE
ncbi:Putative nuclease HARBI1, partial [Trachymyrmex cornetzi]